MFGYSKLVARKKISIEETISDVSLEWITGDIHIFQSDNDEIKIVQITDAKFPERNLFHHKVSNGKLFITDGRKKRIKIGFDFHKTNLEIYLPKRQLHSISIDSTGGHLLIDNLDVIKCKCNITSGIAKLSGEMVELTIHAIGSNVNGKNLNNQKLYLQTTSSKIELLGEFSELNVNSTGRSIVVNSSTMLQKIKSISTGAFVNVSIPENDGFTFQFKGMSGYFKCDFSLISNRGTHIYKNGNSTFNAEVRGGKFTLCKV